MTNSKKLNVYNIIYSSLYIIKSNLTIYYIVIKFIKKNFKCICYMSFIIVNKLKINVYIWILFSSCYFINNKNIYVL